MPIYRCAQKMFTSAPIYAFTSAPTPSAEREPFTLTLSGSGHRNLVIYGPDFLPLYHIETCRHPHNNSTTERTLVFQQDDGDQIYLIACLDFHDPGDWREDTVVYGDKCYPLACYLSRRSKAQYVLLMLDDLFLSTNCSFIHRVRT